MPTRALPAGNIPTVPICTARTSSGRATATRRRGSPRTRRSAATAGASTSTSTRTPSAPATSGTTTTRSASRGMNTTPDSRARTCCVIRGAELVRNHVLPDDEHEVELIIQDRFFTDDGQLRSARRDEPGQRRHGVAVRRLHLRERHAVAGLDVEPRKYRFRIVNGSDSRFYNLELNDPNASFLFVGTELGLCAGGAAQARHDRPGRALRRRDRLHRLRPEGDHDDERGAGRRVRGIPQRRRHRDEQPERHPVRLRRAAEPGSTGLVMRFRVGKRAASCPNATVQPGTILGEPMEDLIATKTRDVLAFQGRDDLQPHTEFLGSMEHGTAEWHEKPTEVVKTGDTEMWEFYNLSPVAHPVHIHLVDFQVIGRQPIDFRGRAGHRADPAHPVQRPARRRAARVRAAPRRSASSGRRRSTSGARRTRSSPTRTR